MPNGFLTCISNVYIPNICVIICNIDRWGKMQDRRNKNAPERTTEAPCSPVSIDIIGCRHVEYLQGPDLCVDGRPEMLRRRRRRREDNGISKHKSNQRELDEEDGGDEASIYCPPVYRYPPWVCL